MNRRVALKVLPFAAAMDPTQLRRFQTEALAAAQLHHTHIVPVYSVGCERGVHYYAMQFIEGQTLAQAIAERRRLEEPPPAKRGSPPSPLRGEGGPQGRMRGRGEGGPQGRMRGERDEARRGSPESAETADRVRRGSPDPAGMPDRRSPASGGAGDEGRPSVTERAATLRVPGDPRRTNDPAETADRVRRGSPDPAGMPDRRSPASGGAGDEGRPSVAQRAATLRVPEDPRPTNEPVAPSDRRYPVLDTSFAPPPAPTIRTATPTPSSRSREYFQTVAALGIQAADALDHAHKVGIVHRDIKPANLLLDVHGNLWITDFGLARLQDDAGLTVTGDLVGTLRYMSPEQALAQRGYLDHRTDVYSLGVTLYELVTLQPAVEGQDRQEVLRKIAQDEPTPPRCLNPSIPRELETILLKAMSKEPELRYATAQELADDLRRFLDDKPIKAKRPTWFEQVVKWSRRHRPVVATAGLVLVLATVGLAIGMALLAREQSRTREQRNIAQAKTREALDKAEALERNLYVNLVNRAKAEFFGGNPALADRLLDECPTERRGWEWYFSKKLCHSDLQTMRGHTEVVHGVAIDPSGRLVASVASDLITDNRDPSELRVWEAETGSIVLARRGLGLNCVAFIPGGLVAVGDGTGVVTFYDVATGDIAHTVGTRGDNAVRRVAFSGDAATLALVRDNGSLELMGRANRPPPPQGRDLSSRLVGRRGLKPRRRNVRFSDRRSLCYHLGRAYRQGRPHVAWSHRGDLCRGVLPHGPDDRLGRMGRDRADVGGGNGEAAPVPPWTPVVRPWSSLQP